MNRFQLISVTGLTAFIVLAVILLLFDLGGNSDTTPEFSLTIWNTAPQDTFWRELTGNFIHEKFPKARITYVAKDPRTYESELLNALAAGSGPDIFVLPDTLLAAHIDKIKALSDGLLGYTKQNFKAQFPDTIVENVTGPGGELWGTPLYFDTLALFYNRDYLNTANIPLPPATWDELVTQSRALTRYSETGTIRRSGIAMGAGTNVAHAADILTLLIYQSGGTVVNPANRTSELQRPETQTALEFYTAFADPTKRSFSWSASFPNSLDAFAAGDAAFVLGYASDIARIKAINPQLNFDVAPVPQTTGSQVRTNLGRFSVLAVSRLSKDTDNAWRVLLWFQEKETQKRYADAFGVPPARRDLIQSRPESEYLVPFYGQILSARTVPLMVGDLLGQIMNDMIESVATRQADLRTAIERASRQLAQALDPSR